jgi:hypothetical protein
MYGYLLDEKYLKDWVQHECGITTATYEEHGRKRCAALKKMATLDVEDRVQEYLHELVSTTAFHVICTRTRLGGGQLRVVRLEDREDGEAGLCLELASNTTMWLAPPRADQVKMLKTMLSMTDEPQWYLRDCI